MNNKNRCAILALYDENGVFGDYIYYLIDELKSVCSRLIIVVNGEISDGCYKNINAKCEEIVVRENVGFDCGAYRHILLNYLDEKELQLFDELIFCNDTFFGPFVPLTKILAKNKDCDFYGISSVENGVFSHIQSYFLVFNKKILESNSLFDFFNDPLYNDINSHNDACAYFEYGLYYYLVTRNFVPFAYVSNVEYFIYTKSHILVEYCEFPIIKKKIFSDKYYDENTIVRSLNFIYNNFDYNLNYIFDFFDKIGFDKIKKFAVTSSNTKDVDIKNFDIKNSKLEKINLEIQDINNFIGDNKFY